VHVAVIGGGIAGATAALRLAEAGVDVTVLESSDRLGGLVVSFSVGGTSLECFYHHVFPHEQDMLALIEELGLGSSFEFLRSTVGILAEGRLWPFTSPVDLLRFGRLPVPDRIRTGVGGLRLQRDADWEALDALPAIDWLRSATGERAVEAVWWPLLRAKFGPAASEVPAAWMWARFQQRRGARRGGTERLGYLRGGFAQVFERLDDRLRRAGADVRTATSAVSVVIEDGEVHAVETTQGDVKADAVLYTGTLPGITRLVPERLQDPRWKAPGLGVLCVVLETDAPLSSIYWTNVCDPTLPFGGIIEHTNLVPATDYGGRHVVYLSRYFTAEEPVASADPRAEASRWVAALARGHPGFDPGTVRAVHPFRTPYAAPLVRIGYRSTIPPLRSHLPGLYVCTTAQIYPQDRGMSEGVRTGTAAAGAILHDSN
jgi:protoporphyrinogen oxidase